jgi:hypothetical protein
LVKDGKVHISSDAESLGRGYLDNELVGGCARTHTPDGVNRKQEGYGVALYAALSCYAYLGMGRICIASAPAGAGFGGRSSDGDKWWRSAVKRGLANTTEVCQGCVAAYLETFIARGLVLWLKHPGPLREVLAGALDEYLEAFLAAEPDPASLSIIEEALSVYAAPAVMQQWRQAWRPAATPNRRRARAARGRPAFVTPELEAHVEALYADLDGL